MTKEKILKKGEDYKKNYVKDKICDIKPTNNLLVYIIKAFRQKHVSC